MGLIFNHSTIERNNGQSFTKSFDVPGTSPLTYTFQDPDAGRISSSTITINGNFTGSHSGTMSKATYAGFSIDAKSVAIGEEKKLSLVSSGFKDFGGGATVKYDIDMFIKRESSIVFSIYTKPTLSYTGGGGNLELSFSGSIIFSDATNTHMVNGDCRFSGRIFVEEL